MNKIITSVAALIITTGVLAQQPIDRSKQPKPGPAPAITINTPSIFKLKNGITVLVVENHKLPKVSASLQIDRGPVLEGNKSGVNGIMGSMLGEGTTKQTKEQFDLAIDQIGADVNLSQSGGFASALTRYFERAFSLFAEGIQSPSFPQSSFEKIISQRLTGLKSSEKSASAISSRVVAAISYGKNTAMGEFETEETIKSLTIEDVKKAYKENITPSRAYLTFVGDITTAQAKAMAEKYFGKWKGNKIELPQIADAPNPKTTEIDFIDLPSAVQGEIVVTNLINNPMSNPDYHALVVANQILGGGSESKLFMNLREKHGFTYGSYSRVGSGRFQAQFSGTAQVRSEKADSAVAEILYEIDNMRNGKITEEELNIAKAKYNGSFALGMEDPERTASYASNILINQLSDDYYKTFLQKINAVTIQDVQRVANKYFDKAHARIVIVGNGAKILPNLSRLGLPVNKYDKYANPVVEESKSTGSKETAKTSDAVSAASVINSYITTIGGKDEIAKIKSRKAIIKMDYMGRELTGEIVDMTPNKKKLEIKMGSMTVQKQVFDGKAGYQSSMGNKKEMDADEINEELEDAGIVPQMNYMGSKFQLNYLGTEKIGEELCYKLKVTKPSGKSKVEFYSSKSNLLVREESTKEAGGQEMTILVGFSDYKKVGNVMMPHTLSQTANDQEFIMQIVEYKINDGVTDEDFK